MTRFNFQILDGSFSKEDAKNLLTRMVDIKVKYHEEKISHSDREEDIKYRERRIKQLQKDLFELRTFIDNKDEKVNINSENMHRTMKTSQALVKGLFSKDEAKEIIRALFHSKIHFHTLAAFSLEERTGVKPIRHLERIKELSASLKILISQIDAIEQDNKQLQIDCQVHLEAGRGASRRTDRLKSNK